MILEKDLQAIGKLVKPHGINGEVVLMINHDTVETEKLSCIIVKLDGIFVPFFLKSVRPKSSETELLTIDGITDEKEAAALCGHEVYALVAELPENEHDDADGMYATDMVGYEVEANGAPLGKIVAIDDSTANYLFIIEKPDGNQVMVPVADEFVEALDPASRKISLQVPQGLLEL